MTSLLDAQLTDFLYWHAVSKMRMAEFHDASIIFKLLEDVCPERTDMTVGRVYCLIRMGQLDLAGELVEKLRKRPLIPMEVALLGRLHRRCEFERSRALNRRKDIEQQKINGTDESRTPKMPHTLGDDLMARLAAEQL